MQLLSIDLTNILDDIKNRQESFNRYIEAISSNPYISVPLTRTTLAIYERLKSYDRESIFKGFRLFVKTNPQWLKLFNALYNKFEYLPEALQMMYNIVDKHIAESYEEKIKVRDLLIALEKESVKHRNKANENGYDTIKVYFETYITQYRQEIDMHKEGGFKAIVGYLKTLDKQLFKVDPAMFENYRSKISSILLILNTIEQKTNQLPEQFRKFEEDLISKDHSVEKELSRIKAAIDIELSKTDVDRINNEYFAEINKD